MVVLGIDPGTQNMGYSVFEVRETSLYFFEIGQITSTITNLTPNKQFKKITKAERLKASKKKVKLLKKDRPFQPPLDIGAKRFIKVSSSILKEYKPDCAVIERFQSRGLKGSTIECVSIMIGIMIRECFYRKISLRLLIASQWKNRVNQFLNLDSFYLETAKLGFTPHETDSMCMPLYHLFEGEDLKKRLSMLLDGLKDYVGRCSDG
jgi:Holliday junction resolvasome RuvABC endonuclease subunit